MDINEKDFYINESQQKCILVNARIQVNCIGRGGGKSSVIVPYKSKRCVDLMPRGCGLLLAPSYQKMLQDLVAPMIRGWNKMGYEEGVDFIVGKEPPKKWNWDKPYLPPRRYEYAISWRNGHIHRIVSQDKSVTSNGVEGHYVKGDEFKLLNGKKFIDETLPCLRGESWLWNHLPEFNSLEFFSDMYFDRRGGDWVIKLYEKLNNDEETELIYKTAITVEHLKNHDPEHPLLNSLEEKLRILRCNAVSIIKAPSTENRYVLGESFFRTMAQTMSIQEFKGAILTMESVGGGDFYAAFDIDVHGYISEDKTDNGLEQDLMKPTERNSKMDTDCDTYLPLKITVDWGGTINSMGIYQVHESSIDKINELYTKPPEKYQALARLFCYYYRYHEIKIVYFNYDPSGNAERADSTETFAQEFAQILRHNGWEVIMVSLGGKNIGHARKHRLWSTVLVQANGKCTDERFKVFRINRTNCPNSIISIANAKIRVIKGAYEKDKSSERKESGVLPEHATHFSDGDDMIMVSEQMHVLENESRGYVV